MDASSSVNFNHQLTPQQCHDNGQLCDTSANSSTGKWTC